jgi:hypothetical protein
MVASLDRKGDLPRSPTRFLHEARSKWHDRTTTATAGFLHRNMADPASFPPFFRDLASVRRFFRGFRRASVTVTDISRAVHLSIG